MAKNTLIVRFKDTPSDATLDEFAKHFQLGQWERNEFLDRQVNFQSNRSLPLTDMTASALIHADGVEMAWRDQLSPAYREVRRALN